MWLGIVIVIAWIILKLLGYIHSPPWQEVLPFVGIGITVLCGAYKFGKQIGVMQETQKMILRDLERVLTTGHIQSTETTRLKMAFTKLRTEFTQHISYYHGK